MDVFQVNTKFITSSRQAVNLVQPEPKLADQIAEATFVVIPAAVEIYSASVSLLKHRPSSTGRFLITEDFKFTQTIRIDFVHSTDRVARLVNFRAVFINYKIIVKKRIQIKWTSVAGWRNCFDFNSFWLVMKQSTKYTKFYLIK